MVSIENIHNLWKWNQLLYRLWVLAIPTNCNKETSKFYLPIMLTVGIEFMTTENKYKMKYKCLKFTKWGSQMKWCHTSFVMEFFFHCRNPKIKDGLTPPHMGKVDIQSFKHINIVLQKKIRWLLYMVISEII